MTWSLLRRAREQQQIAVDVANDEVPRAPGLALDGLDERRAGGLKLEEKLRDFACRRHRERGRKQLLAIPLIRIDHRLFDAAQIEPRAVASDLRMERRLAIGEGGRKAELTCEEIARRLDIGDEQFRLGGGNNRPGGNRLCLIWHGRKFQKGPNAQGAAPGASALIWSKTLPSIVALYSTRVEWRGQSCSWSASIVTRISRCRPVVAHERRGRHFPHQGTAYGGVPVRCRLHSLYAWMRHRRPRLEGPAGRGNRDTLNHRPSLVAERPRMPVVQHDPSPV